MSEGCDQCRLHILSDSHLYLCDCHCRCCWQHSAPLGKKQESQSASPGHWLWQAVSKWATWLSFGLRTSNFPLKSCALLQNHLYHIFYPVFRVLIPGTRDREAQGTRKHQGLDTRNREAPRDFGLGRYGQPDFLELASPSWEETWSTWQGKLPLKCNCL